MPKEIVINSDSQTTRIAIVEDGDLAELFIETEEHERTIGNIFVGKVRRIMPSIQAAFVDIGQKQDAFLHFSDLSDSLPDWLDYVRQEKPDITKFAPEQVQKQAARRRRVRATPRRRLEDGAEDPEVELEEELGEAPEERSEHKRVVGSRSRGRRKADQFRSRDGRHHRSDGSGSSGDRNEGGAPPESLLRRDQPILVKVSKEPIAQKGSRVTTDISLAGRFLVLVPMANYVAVSKKISSFKERRRLRALAKMLLPDGFGVIVRTVAEGQDAKALDTDLRLLKEKWQSIEKELAERPTPPAAVYQDVNMVSSIMRDLFSDNFERILIDNHRTFRNIKGYVAAIAPDMSPKIKMHEAKTPVFRAAGIERSVAEAFESRVNLPSGGYLFIEQTEAMHVVDVNSGRAGRGLSQEENSLKVNLEAARVITKQIRLRDLGGILVIDFIDMRSERSRRKVFDQVRSEFRRDRAVTKVLPMSDFGLMQITRQRLRPSITTTFSDLHEGLDLGPDAVVAPEAERRHTRTVEPTEVVAKIEEWLSAFNVAKWKGAVRLRVHPFTAAYLSKGFLSFPTRCLLRFRLRLKLEPNENTDPGRFRFYDETNGKEIRRPPRRGRRKRGADTEADQASVEAKESAEKEAPQKDRSTKPRGTGTGRSSGGRGRGRDSSSGRGRAGSDGAGNGRRQKDSGSGEAPRQSSRSQAGESRDSRRGRSRDEESRDSRRGRSRGDEATASKPENESRQAETQKAEVTTPATPVAETPVVATPRPEPAPVQEEAPAVQPQRLRYSSSHRVGSDPPPPDKK